MGKVVALKVRSQYSDLEIRLRQLASHDHVAGVAYIVMHKDGSVKTGLMGVAARRPEILDDIERRLF